MSEPTTMNPLSAPFHVETDRLLSPIAVDEPTGSALRYEGTYDRINALRREDDPALEQGVWQTPLKTADWPQVAQECWLAIETQSKDIQIAAWLTEAWIHLHGLAGLREGLHLIAELCDTYWDGLHPDVQEGDLDYRLAPLNWIDDKLPLQLKLVPVTNPSSQDLPPYSLADWELACRLQGRKTANRKEAITLERIQQSGALTPAVWLSAAVSDARGALAALQEVREVLESRCGRQAPALTRLRETLESMLNLLSTALMGREGSVETPATLVVSPASEPEIAAAPEIDHPRGAIRSRAEAYQLLALAAEFLARTEPHSPVPHLIRRAISWGGLSLEDLLPELVRDPNQVSQIYQLLQLGDKLQRS